jgi:hypothetical protein
MLMMVDTQLNHCVSYMDRTTTKTRLCFFSCAHTIHPAWWTGGCWFTLPGQRGPTLGYKFTNSPCYINYIQLKLYRRPWINKGDLRGKLLILLCFKINAIYIYTGLLMLGLIKNLSACTLEEFFLVDNQN